MAGSGKELVPTRPVGRPKGSGGLYSKDVADEILERMIDGETLVHICKYELSGRMRERGEFPNHATVYDWGDPGDGSHIPEFSTRFARAKLAQQRNWVESTVDIARNTQLGIEEIVEHSTKNGVSLRRARKDMLGHRALQIDTLHKAVARMNPAHWAERLQQVAPSENDQSREPPKLIIEGGLPDTEDGPPPATPDTE
jgi:hypothetical protein